VILFRSEVRGRYDNDVVRYGCICCKDGVEQDAERLSYVKQASEGSYLFIDKLQPIQVKHIFFKEVQERLNLRVDHSSIYFELKKQTSDILSKWNQQTKGNYTFPIPIRTQFELKYSYFSRLHKAIDRLPGCVVDRLIPIGNHLSTVGEPNWFNDEKRKSTWVPYESLYLDRTCQQQALELILNSKSKYPLLIAGPFGTGKTRVLARAAFEILRLNRKNKILICAHHQASVDTFIDYFITLKEDVHQPWHQKFVRVGPSNYQSPVRKKYPNLFISVTGFNKSSHQASVVVTTLGLAMFFQKNFSHILIDEGAQVREPEIVGPLSLATENTRIIIAGDHNQVQFSLILYYYCSVSHYQTILSAVFD